MQELGPTELGEPVLNHAFHGFSPAGNSLYDALGAQSAYGGIHNDQLAHAPAMMAGDGAHDLCGVAGNGPGQKEAAN